MAFFTSILRRRTAAVRPRPFRFQPAVEPLEDRCVPAIQVVDPYPTLVNSSGQVIAAANAAQVDLLASAQRFRTGIAADGNTKLVVRQQSDTPVTFTLDDVPAGDLSNGSLQLLGSTVRSTTVTVNPVQDSQGTWWVFALYQAPRDFSPTPVADADRPIEIVADSQAGTELHTLSLERPPVVLVHGMWGNSLTWVVTGFTAALRNAGFRVFYADYGRHNADTFDPRLGLRRNYPALAVHNGIRQALLQLRSEGTAVTQVDVIGHSLGGLAARAYENYSVYRNLSNYNRGYFHKLITIGTPHAGSPLASVLYAHRNDRVNGVLGFFGMTVKDAFALAGFPIGTAVRDLRPGSGALRAIGRTNAPAFAIAGLAGDGTASERRFNSYLAYISPRTVDQILGESNDLTVGLGSARGRLSPANSLVFRRVVHVDFALVDTNEQESPAIQAAVIDLLRGSVSRFAAGGFPRIW